MVSSKHQQNNHSDHQLRTNMENLLFRQEQRVGKTENTKKNNFVLGKIPPKTQDFSKMTTEEDKINYEALCRGEDLLEPAVRKVGESSLNGTVFVCNWRLHK